MTKRQLQAKHLGMTERKFLERKIELMRQYTEALKRQLPRVSHDTTRQDAESGLSVQTAF